jgi:hypothetical protein
VTAPALALCCAFAIGALHVAPPSWRPSGAAVYSADVGSKVTARIFGVALAGPELPRWSAETGIRPQLLMSFQAWCHRASPAKVLAQARADHVTSVMITWDPWCPTPAGDSAAQEGRDQPRFANWTIAAGHWDGYIRSWADTVRNSGLTVYVRYAHEMNGTWYPWHWGPRAYVAAWRHVVTLFRRQHASNARFVWSGGWGTPKLTPGWTAGIRAYWPGRSYVSYVGDTAINFGGAQHTHLVSQFKPVLAWAHRAFGRPLMLTEVNTEYAGRVAWIHHLAAYAAATPWLKAIVWSQLPSYGAADMAVGDMKWQVADDSHGSKAALRALAAVMDRPGRKIRHRAVADG